MFTEGLRAGSADADAPGLSLGRRWATKRPAGQDSEIRSMCRIAHRGIADDLDANLARCLRQGLARLVIGQVPPAGRVARQCSRG